MVAPEIVRKVRVLVVEQGVSQVDAAQQAGLSKSQVYHIVIGNSYRSAGGPIRTPRTRHRGERRVCTRCRHHKDEPAFVIKHDEQRGICTSCAKPADIERAQSRPSKWAGRQRQDEKRAVLRVEIERLSSLPWGESLLTPADRDELEAKRVEIMRAKRVCQSAWGRTA